MSSLNLLLNHEASSTSPPLPPSAPPPEASPAYSGSALDFLAEAAMNGSFGDKSVNGDGSGMDGVEEGSSGRSHQGQGSPPNKYQLDSSFFPAAPDAAYLPPPQRSSFSLSPNGAHHATLSVSPHAKPQDIRPSESPSFNFDFGAPSGSGGLLASPERADHHGIPADLLNWDEPLSAAERVKLGRRKVPAAPAPPPPPPAPQPRQPAQAPSQPAPVSMPRPISGTSSSLLFTLPVLAAPPPVPAPPPPPQVIPMVVVPKKERKTSQVPPANPVTSPSNGFYPPGTVGARPAFPLPERPPSMVSDQGFPSYPYPGGSESGASSNPGSSVPPQFGEPVLKPGGRKRVLGPDGKPVKKVKVPGRGQAWRKGLGGVGTGSAAPKLSTPLELFTAPSGPPRPKKPKKPKTADDGAGSASGSASGSVVPQHEYNSAPLSSNGASSAPPAEKAPKSVKPKVSKPGTHPKKAMPKFGPELPPHWQPTNLPIGQRPRDPTPPILLPVVQEQDEDLGVYCLCEMRYDEDKPMIACDKCDEWYHPSCVGINDEKVELVDIFVCPKCFDKTPDRTTWKPKCKSQACYKPCVPPLTKYCSPACGVAHLTAVASAQAAPLVSMLPKVSNSRRPGGITTAAAAVVAEPDASTISSPSSKSLLSSPEQDGPNPLLATMRTSLATLDKDITEQSAKLDLIGKRLELLQKASDRSDRIEARKQTQKREKDEKDKQAAAGEDAVKVEGAEEEKEKPAKSKGKKPDAQAKESADRECGFDRRLVMGEREFADWCESDEGQRTLSTTGDNVGEDETGHWCQETRKKCDGHAEWQKWRKVDFEMERDQKDDRVKKLKRKQTIVTTEIVELEAEEKARVELAKAKVTNANANVTVNGQSAANVKPLSQGSDSVKVVNPPVVPAPNSFSRQIPSIGSGDSVGKGLTGFASFGSAGGAPASYSNERGGYSSMRGGDEGLEEDVEMS